MHAQGQAPETVVAGIAGAIGSAARARMLYCLHDGRARTATELALAAGVTPATASVHLQRLRARGLVEERRQGRYRYFQLRGAPVAAALEALSVLAGDAQAALVSRTPGELRAARTCYDHIAGALGVALHDRFHERGWLSHSTELTAAGEKALGGAGVPIAEARAARRRFAYGCMDWSERRPHLAGALGAAVLELALRRKWLVRELDSRALRATALGRTELYRRFGVRPDAITAAAHPVDRRSMS